MTYLKHVKMIPIFLLPVDLKFYKLINSNRNCKEFRWWCSVMECKRWCQSQYNMFGYSVDKKKYIPHLLPIHNVNRLKALAVLYNSQVIFYEGYLQDTRPIYLFIDLIFWHLVPIILVTLIASWNQPSYNPLG